MNQAKVYHILNGDALAHQLTWVDEEKIIFREALIEGSVSGNNLTELFESRKQFFKENYKNSKEDYSNKSISEISKIKDIIACSSVVLWFEHDLFCQVNFWAAVHFLNKLDKDLNLFLVSPIPHSWSGFGNLSEVELKNSFRKMKLLSTTEREGLSQMWLAYQDNLFESLKLTSLGLTQISPLLPEVVKAHIDRFPIKNKLGKPQQTLLNIFNTSADKTFDQIFQAFCVEEGVYGFGDLQVKRLIQDLGLNIENNN